MKKTLVILIFLLGCFAVGSYLLLDLLNYAATPTSKDSTPKVVAIPAGGGFKVASEILYQAGVIKAPFKFKLLARIKGYDKRIKAGEYAVTSSLPPSELLEILVSGKVYLHKITIPEGYTLVQISSIVAGEGLGAQADFLKDATDGSFAREKGIDADTSEGYLFPDTYYFPKGVTAKKIISTMVNRFWSVFTPEWKAQAQKIDLSIHQVVTLASIIEKETGAPQERPIISSVFHNRLNKGMRLETDPTVIYGIKDFDGNITRKHLETQTPYNTYMVKGLPPGPISNPGRKAIEAALYPADTPFLYFVSKKDNTHQFSTNIADHNRAVKTYQMVK